MAEVDDLIESVAVALELAGVATILATALYATAVAIRRYRNPETRSGLFDQYRAMLGRGILLGLEFLVAGDIINTVAIEPTYSSVGTLAIIVLIRTFLSFTLEVEMTGRWPWQGADRKNAQTRERV